MLVDTIYCICFVSHSFQNVAIQSQIHCLKKSSKHGFSRGMASNFGQCVVFVIIIIHMLSSPWTSKPQGPSLPRKNKRNRCHNNSEKSENRACPPITCAQKHLTTEERETCSCKVPNQALSSQSRCGEDLEISVSSAP